ncbi:MAG: N-acetylmuramoyl-L-alanine amidase, partial [Desulfobacterales bacterium]|nr:N-acetylmuramoyl-L-alanine amidase [Desulfobacterales bacterium]
MIDKLPDDFGRHKIFRCWIPQGRVHQTGATPPRPGIRLAKVDKIIVGDTGRRGLRAVEAARDIGQAYGHFLIDHDAIVECIPALTSSMGLVEQAAFVKPIRGQTLTAQESAIAVNLCFGGGIAATEMYARCVALVAFLCDRFELSPDKDVKGASELDRARKDPETALREAGASLSKLVQDVAARLNDISASRRSA